MKATFLILLLSGAIVVGNKVANEPVIAPTEDKEFQQLMDDFHQTLSKNKEIQVQADKAKEAIVSQTISKVTELKQETIALKTELNEVKSKLDSANAIDTGSKFKFKPIGR